MSTRTFGARIERNIDPKLLRGEDPSFVRYVERLAASQNSTE